MLVRQAARRPARACTPLASRRAARHPREVIPFSVLDLSPIAEGATAAQAFRNTLDLAQHAERWGYHRYWLAEHHNMPGIASAATAVVIGHVAGGTSTIRVGAGGIMLPNHAPLVIAEQFGTLESLYPGRIDLGLGRAPGTDPRTAHGAAPRSRRRPANAFPKTSLELQSLLRAAAAGTAVRAVPGAGLTVPIWLLGSSLFSAQLAAELGLPFAFASHFAPDASAARRSTSTGARFRPSRVARGAVRDGRRQRRSPPTPTPRRSGCSRRCSSQFVNLRRGAPGPLPPPVDSMDGRWSPAERAGVDRAFACAAVGSPDTVRRRLRALVEQTQADELILTAQIFEHRARLRSLEIVAALHDDAPTAAPSVRQAAANTSSKQMDCI